MNDPKFNGIVQKANKININSKVPIQNDFFRLECICKKKRNATVAQKGAQQLYNIYTLKA